MTDFLGFIQSRLALCYEERALVFARGLMLTDEKWRVANRYGKEINILELIARGYMTGDWFSGMGTALPDARRAFIRSLIDCGLTGSEIGRELGITRERVRKLAGGKTAHECPADVLVVLRRIRSDPSVTSVNAIVGEASGEQYMRAARELGMEPAIRRLFRWRRMLSRRAADPDRRDRAIQHLRRLAKRLGRTPGFRDIVRHSPPSHETYLRLFGSIRGAQIAAGLTPNERGGRGSVRYRRANQKLRPFPTPPAPPRAGATATGGGETVTTENQ